MIRDARLLEVVNLVDMGRETFERLFLMRGNPDAVEVVLTRIVCEARGYLRVYERNGEIAGFLAGAVAPLRPWSDDLCATELLFYVAPEHRASRAAVSLLNDFIAWGKEQKCTAITVTAQSDEDHERVSKFYERMGFSHMETHYARDPETSRTKGV